MRSVLSKSSVLDELKTLTKQHLEHLLPADKLSSIDVKFKRIISGMHVILLCDFEGLMDVAKGLVSGKDNRNVLVDLMDKVGEVFRKIVCLWYMSIFMHQDFSKDEMQLTLEAIDQELGRVKTMNLVCSDPILGCHIVSLMRILVGFRHCGISSWSVVGKR